MLTGYVLVLTYVIDPVTLIDAVSMIAVTMYTVFCELRASSSIHYACMYVCISVTVLCDNPQTNFDTEGHCAVVYFRYFQFHFFICLLVVHCWYLWRRYWFFNYLQFESLHRLFVKLVFQHCSLGQNESLAVCCISSNVCACVCRISMSRFVK